MQQHTFKAMQYIFPPNNPSVISELQSVHSRIISPSEMASPADVRPAQPTLLVTRPCNHSGTYFSNFKNSQKIEEKSYDYNFFTNVIRTIKGSLEQLHGMNCLYHCVTCDLVIFAKFIPLFIGYTCRHNCYVCKKGLT